MGDIKEDINLEKQELNKPERDEKGRLLPGNTANPNGRPKGKTLTEVIRSKLEELSPDRRRTAMEWLADNILQDALDHDNSMRKLIWNYLEGLPKQSIDLGNTGNLPFTIKIEQINGGSTTTESKDGQIV